VVPTRSTNPEDLAARIRGVVGDYAELAAVWLFGSGARGELRADSDVDVAVLLTRAGETSLDHHRRLLDLASRLEAALDGRRIDLVVLTAEQPMLSHQVLAEGVLVFERDRTRRIDFESTAHVRYLDFLPTWQIAARASVKGFEDWLEARR
jgi:predicted nucleotidyltransferase